MTTKALQQCSKFTAAKFLLVLLSSLVYNAASNFRPDQRGVGCRHQCDGRHGWKCDLEWHDSNLDNEQLLELHFFAATNGNYNYLAVWGNGWHGDPLGSQCGGKHS